MRANKKLAITTICKKYGKIVCGPSITLATVQFSFFNPPILAIQLPQNFFFDNIIIEIHFSPTSVILFLSPLSYFFLEFRQWYYQNSLLSSYFQINLNSNHITNKTAVFTIFSQKTHCVFSSIIDPTGSLNYWQVLHTHKSFEVLVKKIIWSCSHLQRDFLL